MPISWEERSAVDDSKKTALTQAPRRRWYQRLLHPRFSLRTFLIFITLFSLTMSWLGNWVYRGEQQRRAVKKIQSFDDGFCILYDDQLQNWSGLEKTTIESWLPDWISESYGQEYFHKVCGLSSYPCKAQNFSECFKYFPELQYLKYLDMREFGCKFKSNCVPEFFENVGKLTSLEELRIDGACFHLDPKSNCHLQKLHKLKRLIIEPNRASYQDANYKFIDQDLSLFISLKTLEELTIYDPEFSSEDIEYLTLLKNLKILHLVSIEKIDDNTIEYLKNHLPNLETYTFEPVN